MKPRLFLVMILSFLAGCAPTIDSTDTRTFQKSVQRMSDSLDGDLRKKFRDAVWALEMDTAAIVPAITRTEEQRITVLRDRLDGLTAEEVIKMGTPVLEAYFDSRRKLLTELRERKAAHDANVARERELMALLSLNVVKRSKAAPYSSKLHIDASNGLPYAVASIQGTATLTVPGRPVPLSKKSIKHKFFGGLQPGESKSIVIEIFDSIWSRADLPKNSKIDISLQSVIAIEASGAEKIMINGRGMEPYWGTLEEMQLRELIEQFGEDSSVNG